MAGNGVDEESLDPLDPDGLVSGGPELELADPSLLLGSPDRVRAPVPSGVKYQYLGSGKWRIK